MARRVFRLKPPKIHWEKNLYTLTQQVGRRNVAGDDVKIPEEKRDRWQASSGTAREGSERKKFWSDLKKTYAPKLLDFTQKKT